MNKKMIVFLLFLSHALFAAEKKKESSDYSPELLNKALRTYVKYKIDKKCDWCQNPLDETWETHKKNCEALARINKFLKDSKQK